MTYGFWLEALQWTLALVGAWLMSGTAINFSTSPNWYVRGWDFPRNFTAALAIAVGGLWAWLCAWQWWDWAFLLGLLAVVGVQVWNIYPYTPLASKQVFETDRPTRTNAGDRPRNHLRMVATNVLMENGEHEKWRDVVTAADPDLILAVEVDDEWREAMRPLEDKYPHVVAEPRGNHYGMALLSRLELVDPDIRHVVQDETPSIKAGVRLRDGTLIRLYGLHPSPPEPQDNQDSTPRDAELVIVGREIGDDPADEPTVVSGDLNDVAWSHTTRLFLRLSGLLDPRVGRGFFNSFHAQHWFIRFPLDHFFHSNDFRLVELRRLESVGSDHFPMLLELSYEPDARAAQPEQAEEEDDQAEADEMIEDQVQAELSGKEHGHLSEHRRIAGLA